jgi:glycosyltransferase 2 family protein
VAQARRLDFHRTEVAVACTGAAILCGSWVVVTIDARVPGWERNVFEWINGTTDTAWPVLWGPMQLGSFIGSLVVVGVTGAVTRDHRLTLAMLTASQAAFWSAKLVKASVSRERPAALLPDVNLRESADGFGYLSGHAAVSFALAAALAPSLPRAWRPVPFVAAGLVALGRVYAGAHLPLDVIGGAGLGVLAGLAARRVFGLRHT